MFASFSKVVACALAGLLATAVAASADPPVSYQWSGASTSGVNWSDGANWTQQPGPGGMGTVARAPAQDESVNALTFGPQTTEAHNDVSGLTVDQLTVSGNRLTGNPITLGAGGLTISTATTQSGSVVSGTIDLPMTLGANQTWTGQGSTTLAGIGVAVTGGLTGTGSSLTINGGLALGGDNEIGDVTVGGPSQGQLVLRPGSKLNATDGHGVTLPEGGLLASYGGTLGALTDNGYLQVGQPTADSPGSLNVASATLGRSVSFALAPKTTSTTPGTDYGQLSSTGAVNLNGARLTIDKTGTLSYDRYGNPTGPGPYCGLPAPVGTVYTLVSSSGPLTGTFANVYGDRLMKDACVPSPGTTIAAGQPADQPNTYRIDYTANSVTATVVNINQPYGICGASPCFTPLRPTTSTPSGPTAAQISAALAKLGAPKSTSIRKLLKKGSYTYTVAAPAAGKLTVAWYQVPKGAKLAKVKKPLLVAAGAKVAAKAGSVKLVVKLTSAGKRTLKKAKRSLKLTSKASFAPNVGKATSRTAAFKLKR